MKQGNFFQRHPGADFYSLFWLLVFLALAGLGRFFPPLWIPALVALVYLLFRLFSRNAERRQMENARFLALFRSVTPLILLIIAEAFFGAADGMVLVSPNALAQRDLSPTEMGSGLSFLGFCSTIGNSAGSAITGCIVAQFWSADRAFADAEASVTALHHGLSMAFGLSFVCCVLLLIYLLRSGRNIEKSTV